MRYVELSERCENAGGGLFPHPARLVVFRIDDVQPGGTAGCQQLFIRTDDRQPKRFQFQG